MATSGEPTLERFAFLHDPAGRAARARRIVALLRDCAGVSLDGKRVLDVGCSAGLMTREIAAGARFTVGLEIAADALAYAAAHHSRRDQLAFIRGSAERLPFPTAAFDVVICNHVYEHVADVHALLAEIERVLRPGGVCWFAAGHTFQLVEPHHRLPLRAAMPRSWASAVMRLLGRGGSYDERFVPPWRLRSLLRVIGTPRLASAAALRDPERYELATGLLRYGFTRRLIRRCAVPVAWLAPTHLWIVEKPR
jgi:2-polyprenyl-3-methyl-5-hydroxy-6-metoxy-1,4-benzoquinol methylase